MNKQEEARFSKLAKQIINLLTENDGDDRGLGRAFRIAVEIVQDKIAAKKKYGIEKTFPATEKQLALMEQAIVEARAALDKLAQERADDAAKQAEERAIIEANNAKTAARTPEQIERDTTTNQFRHDVSDWHHGFAQNAIRERIEKAAQAEYVEQCFEQREAIEDMYALPSWSSDHDLVMLEVQAFIEEVEAGRI